MKKKLLALLFVLAAVLYLAACSSNETSQGTPQDNAPQEQTQDQEQTQPQEDTPSVPQESQDPAHEETLVPAGDLGEYHVEIKDFQLITDYEGKAAILVSYDFTNNGDEEANAMWSLSDLAYQNGVQLDNAIVMDSSIMNSDDKMKDLQKGATLEIKEAFLLASDTAPVEFEVSELISADDAKVGKTFAISEGGATVLSTAPAGDVTGELGDYTVSIVSYKLSEDYEGAPVIIINLGFTNNGDSTANFMTSIDCSAFQDGVELETAVVVGEDSGNGESQMRNVKPGAGIPISVAYLLSSETSPVDLQIEELFSFSDKKLETTIPLA